MYKKIECFLLSLIVWIGALSSCAPAFPQYEPYVPLIIDVVSYTLPFSNVTQMISHPRIFEDEDIYEKIPEKKTFKLGNKEYETTLVEDGFGIGYQTADGKYRIDVFRDAEFVCVTNNRVGLDNNLPLTATYDECVAIAREFLSEVVADSSIYEPFLVEDASAGGFLKLEMCKLVDGYPSDDKAAFCFVEDGQIQYAQMPHIGKIKNPSRVQYDLERATKAVDDMMKQIIEKCERKTVLKETIRYDIAFQRFTILKNDQIALEFLVKHTYSINSDAEYDKDRSGVYRLVVPI